MVAESRGDGQVDRLQARYVWLFAFCYITVVALVFQKLLLPALPSLHAGAGLMQHDAAYNHEVAQHLANVLRTGGWTKWTPWSPENYTTGNVAVLGALYAIFRPDPALIIPINAALHATGAVMLLLIARCLWPGRVGVTAGLVGAALFVVFPSALSWYSQPLKDSYVIAGILLVMYAWLKAIAGPLSKLGFIVSVMQFILGTVLVGFVKYYYLKLLFAIAVLVLALMTIHALMVRRRPAGIVVAFFALMLAFLAIGLSLFEPKQHRGGSGMEYAEWIDDTAPSTSARQWQWRKSLWMPAIVERNAEIIARTRAGVIRFNESVGAGSLIDGDRMPESIGEVAAYSPRNLLVSLFAPFPQMWFEKVSLPRLVVAAESMVWYLVAPGVLMTFLFQRRLPVLVAVVVAVCFASVLGFVTPNAGTMYRYRYVFEFLLILVGLAGWIEAFFTIRGRRSVNCDTGPLPREPMTVDATSEDSSSARSKKALVGAAAWISLITFAGYLGFFARDLAMVRWFGATDQVDVFFLGSMLPMFLVAVLCLPAGTALVPAYTAWVKLYGRQSALKCAAKVTGRFILILIALAIVAYSLTPESFALLGWSYSEEKLLAIQNIATLYLVIFVLGGVMIAGNAILNAEGHVLLPAAAQLVVPVVALGVLAAFGSRYGVYAVAYGMLAGQVANLLLVGYALRRAKVFEQWEWGVAQEVRDIPYQQYLMLVVSALSTALFVPVSNVLAATLPSGSVALASVGAKVVALVTGIASIGITTVLLPHFSRLVAKLNYQDAKSDLSYFLLLVTLLSVPVALVLSVLAEPISYFAMSGGALSESDTAKLVRIVQYGIIQLPFFTSSVVAIKYISAYQKSAIILASSLVGLVLTILCGQFLARYLGVAGIVLGITLSMAVSATMLIIYANRLRHLPLSDVLFVVFNWVVFLTMFICLHYQSYVGFAIAAIAYVLLVMGSWHALLHESTRPDGMAVA